MGIAISKNSGPRFGGENSMNTAKEYADNLMKRKHAIRMRQKDGKTELQCSCGWYYVAERYGTAKIAGDQHLDETRDES